jgi:acetylornithine deacetylase/succinyl-diaminopimelate desuccinylase-like protein
MEVYAFVGQIIERFGPRSPCSDAERQAQQWVAKQFETLAGPDQVRVQRFRASMTAKFASLKVFVAFFALSMGLVWFSVPLAGALGLLNVLLFMGHFVLYRDWLDPLFPKADSCNVIATLEPSGKVRSTLLVAGHVDSATEFQWWFRFGQAGITATVLAGFALVVSGLFLGILALAGSEFATPTVRFAWYALVVLAPLQLCNWSMHGDRVVDGAIDNLSGLAVAWGVGRQLARPGVPGQSTLQHTRIKLVSFGSEECGLKGSRAYVREFEQELRAENAVLLNMESFKDDQHLTILTGEAFTGARYPRSLNDRLGAAMRQAGCSFTETMLMVGATDATSFANRGLPATCVIGLTSDKLDPTYHTRRDNMEHLERSGMEAMVRVLVHFAEAWDREEQPKA